MFYGFFLHGTFTGPFSATSRTDDIDKPRFMFDWLMLVPPVRTFFICLAVPQMYLPMGAAHAYGFLRCLWTAKWPWTVDRVQQMYEEGVQYCVYRRTYDSRTKRMNERPVEDPAMLARALSVSGTSRNMYVDDPMDKQTAFYVMERRTYTDAHMWRNFRFFGSLMSDTFRYLVPVLICWYFHKPAVKVTNDLVHIATGKLHYTQVRHPVPNFFKTVTQYRQSQERVNITRAPPKGVKPWHYKL